MVDTFVYSLGLSKDTFGHAHIFHRKTNADTQLSEDIDMTIPCVFTFTLFNLLQHVNKMKNNMENKLIEIFNWIKYTYLSLPVSIINSMFPFLCFSFKFTMW